MASRSEFWLRGFGEVEFVADLPGLGACAAVREMGKAVTEAINAMRNNLRIGWLTSFMCYLLADWLTFGCWSLLPGSLRTLGRARCPAVLRILSSSNRIAILVSITGY